MGATSGALVGTGGRPRSFSRPQLALSASDRPVQSHPPAPAGPFWVRGPGKRSTGHAWYFVTIQNIEGWPSRQGVNGSPEMGFGLFAALAAIGPAMERTASMSGGSDGDRPANSGRLSGSMPSACHCRASTASRHGSEARSFIAPERNCWQCPLFGEGAYVPWQRPLLSATGADVCRSCASGGGKRRAQGADLRMRSAGPCCPWI